MPTLAWHPPSTDAAVYTTWNSADKETGLTLSNGDKTVTGGAANYGTVRSVKSNSTGKWYCEFTATTVGTEDELTFGIANASEALNVWLGNTTNAWALYFVAASTAINKRTNNTNTGLTSTGNLAATNIIMMAWDADAGKLWFGKDGTWLNAGAGAGDPAAGTNETFASVSGTLMIAVNLFQSGEACTLNAGATAFAYAAPSGFTGWTA